jgi:hypothetical protein
MNEYHRAAHLSGARFTVVRRTGLVPMMAGCTGCGRKFFTPGEYSRNEVVAEQNLLEKFDQHSCLPDVRKW